MPNKPPKKWWDDCTQGVTESGYADDPESVCGSQWYHKMSASEKRKIVKAAEKRKKKKSKKKTKK